MITSTEIVDPNIFEEIGEIPMPLEQNSWAKTNIDKELNLLGIDKPWYIWYEVYLNGEKIGHGRWPTAYKYKKNAVRKARKMCDKDIYNPRLDRLIHKKWIVNQIGPYDFINPFDEMKGE